MGKVLSKFTNGWPGAVSRSVDNVIAAMKNDSDAAIPFGAPVFLSAGENAVKPFDASASTSANFVGFTVRVPDKTPETYGSSTGTWNADDPVEVLVRGSVVLYFENNVSPGASVYVRKVDGKLVVNPGTEGSTVLLPGVTVRTARDTARCAEVVLTKRNVI